MGAVAAPPGVTHGAIAAWWRSLVLTNFFFREADAACSLSLSLSPSSLLSLSISSGVSPSVSHKLSIVLLSRMPTRHTRLGILEKNNTTPVLPIPCSGIEARPREILPT